LRSVFVGRGQDRAVGDADRDKRAALAERRERGLGGALGLGVQCGFERFPRRRFEGEEFAVLRGAVRRLAGGHDLHAARAAQARVPALLQAALADEVGRGIFAGILVHDLFGDRADGAEHRAGKGAALGEHSLVLVEPHAGQRLQLCSHRVVGLSAQRDDLHELVVVGGVVDAREQIAWGCRAKRPV
jgi:hypothetical protein